MLGASASDEENGERESVLQIVKHRSLVEKLLGREKLSEGDACASFFRDLLEKETRFKNVSVDLEP